MGGGEGEEQNSPVRPPALPQGRTLSCVLTMPRPGAGAVDFRGTGPGSRGPGFCNLHTPRLAGGGVGWEGVGHAA